VAVRNGLDLVLVERKPEMPTNPADMDKLTADQVQAVLAQRDVLYMNSNADITAAVTAEVNKKYSASPAPSATGTPPAPTPPTTPPATTPPAPAGGKKYFAVPMQLCHNTAGHVRVAGGFYVSPCQLLTRCPLSFRYPIFSPAPAPRAMPPLAAWPRSRRPRTATFRF
jgi:hypothetical protein